MKPRKIVDLVVTPDNRELVLYEQDTAFEIQIDSDDLMTSRAHGSEDEMARIAFETLGFRAAPRVLIGGLGMGFTLRATLDLLGDRKGASVVVAEVFPAVVRWNRGPLAHLAKRPLEDRRVEVEESDVARVLASSDQQFDIVLLDVDNGPDAMTLDSNRRLYSERGLEESVRSLKPGGVLAVWSAGDDPRFTDRLRRSGLETRVHRVRERPGKGAQHVIFVGKTLCDEAASRNGPKPRQPLNVPLPGA